MSVIVAAPVAEREWAIPHWYQHLAEQSVPPDEIVLLHSGQRGDATWHAIDLAARDTGIVTHRLHDPAPPHPRHDNARFKTLARLRNMMLAWATIATDHDYLFSLDTDILLTNPHTIDRLQRTASIYGCSSPLVYLHPDMPWTVNAGMFPKSPFDYLGELTPEILSKWPWTRAEPTPAALAGDAAQVIDIPMAATMMVRDVYDNVRYGEHESGEDISFALKLALQGRGAQAAWVPSIEAKHLWDSTRL
jgi:hypothetical protein